VFIKEYLLKQLLALGICGVFLFVLFYTIHFVRQHNTPISFAFTRTKADVQIDRFSLVQSQNGAKDWELVAKRAKMYDKDSKAVLEDVQVKVFGYRGVGLSFDADKGVLNTATKDLFFERYGKPLAVSLSSGYTIYSPSLDWQDTKREVLANGPVTIVGSRVEISGNRLIMGADTGDFQVIGNVEAKVQ